jgi:hypothetical protein
MIMSDKDEDNLKKHVFFFRQESQRIAILTFIMQEFSEGIVLEMRDIAMAAFYF